ncbi:MAG: hypothetical protein ACOCP8_01915 [archaeon]
MKDTYLEVCSCLSEFYIKICYYPYSGQPNTDQLLAQYLNITEEKLFKLYEQFDIEITMFSDYEQLTYFKNELEINIVLLCLKKYELISHLRGIPSIK